MNPEYANILKYAMQMEKDGAQFFRDSAARFRTALRPVCLKTSPKWKKPITNIWKTNWLRIPAAHWTETPEDAMMNQENRIFFFPRRQ